MDSLTHLALGAAIGEAALGRRIGRRAMLWGAAIASVPDLDVLAGFFVSDLDQLIIHRGPSHSVLAVLLLAPMLGYVLSRLYRKHDVSWQSWTLLTLPALFSHILLDACTTYGTQLLWPFSAHPVSWNTISIIDPLFTLPLLAAVTALLVLHRDSRSRLWITRIGYGLSAAYFAFTLYNKAYMNRAFERALASQQIPYERYFVKPTLLNNVLWRGIAESRDGYWIGFHSRLDAAETIPLQYVPKNQALLDPVKHTEAVRRLVWISQGYYTVAREEGDLYFNDLRFGQVSEWTGQPSSYAFSYRITRANAPQSGEFDIERVRLSFARDDNRPELGDLFLRIRGH